MSEQTTTQPTDQPTVPAVLSVYQASKVATRRLIAEGVDAQIPPQMFYNYVVARVRKGKAPIGGLVAAEYTKGDGSTAIGMTTASFETWLAKYVARKHFEATLANM